MQLCVGAVTRRVIEEAALLQAPQIVASRRQVNGTGGYTGITQRELVELIHKRSAGTTKIVRDHGGPMQDGNQTRDEDCWVNELEDDVTAGFDALHLDVSLYPGDLDAKIRELQRLLHRFGGRISVEIGGERDDQRTLDQLLDVALHYTVPTFAVIDLGGHIRSDKQCGTQLLDMEDVDSITQRYRKLGVRTKAHNMDWMGNRRRYDDVLDAYNVAPEFAGVEVDAWLHVMSMRHADQLLEYAYDSEAWHRWFSWANEHDGTWYERARCAVRYVMLDEPVAELIDRYSRTDGCEEYVRGRIRDAITCG